MTPPLRFQVNDKGNTVILDKTGRLQEFNSMQGQFVQLIGTIPAGLGNGFCIDKSRNQYLVTCSGIVLSEEEHGRAEINDWVELLSIS